MKLNELIHQSSLRNERAMHELYKFCFQTMMRICRRYCNNEEDAVDLSNQSFLKIITNLKVYRAEESFEAWIKKITVNTCIDGYRKNKRYRSRVVLSEEQQTGKLEVHGRTDNDALQKLNADEIYKMIEALPDKAREVFNLFAIDGYNHKEIAEMINITDTTSRWYLHKARGILQENIEKMYAIKPLAYEK